MKMKKFSQKRSINPIAQAPALTSLLMPFGERVLADAMNDPSEYYRSLLQIHTNVTKAANQRNVSRTTVVVGARRDRKDTGLVVEAKRGTLAKALGRL